MAHRLLFRNNRLLFGSLTRMHKYGSKISHSYRKFSNKSSQTGSWNKWYHIGIGGCIAVLGAGYNVYSGNKTFTGSKTGRALIVMGIGVVCGSALIGGYYGISRMLPKFADIYRTFMASTTSLLAVSGTIYTVWGEKSATEYSRMEAFSRDSRIIGKARAAMKETKTIAGVFNQHQLLASRNNDSLELCEAIKALIDNDCYLVLSGMKEGGKTVLVQDAVIKLKKEGIPTVYIPVGKYDKESFLNNCAQSFGIDEVLRVLETKLEWDDVLTLIRRVCGKQGDKGEDKNGNVIIFDNVSQNSPCLAKIDNLARMMGQKYPNTAVVIVASDATDVFYTRPELRRTVKTLMPFNLDQIEDYLTNVLDVSKESKLQYTDKDGNTIKQSDASRMVEMISTSYTPSLVSIKKLVFESQNKDKSIDFVKAEAFIATKREILCNQFGLVCEDKETLKKLQEFVALQKDEPFNTTEWGFMFGSIDNPASIGYKLLYRNLMFYEIEKGKLTFHSPIVTQAISNFKI